MDISKANYKSVIDDLDVVNTSKYQPSGNKTYCNIFAQIERFPAELAQQC